MATAAVRLALVGLVVLAGCASTGSPATTEVPTPTAAPTEAKARPTPTPSPTPTPKAVANPWGRTPIVVATHYPLDAGLGHDAQVQQAIEYWAAEGAGYANWTPAFVLRPAARDPDVVVRFVEDVERCGFEVAGDFVGCASVLQPDTTPADPEVVRVDAELDNESTYAVTRHEFGHLLGLHHGHEPVDVMANATEVRPAVMTDRPYRVFVEYNDILSQGRAKRQVQHALDYYDRGAEGFVDDDIAFELVENRSTADITIVFTNDRSRDDGSIGDFESMTIRIDGITPPQRGWHVGYWLGLLLGARSTDELPPPFDEPKRDERREWW